jgi:hypothetical protein
MTQAKPLLDLLDDLRVDAGEQHAYAQDPEGYLASHGWADLDPLDLVEALGFVREAASIDVAVTIPDTPADVGPEHTITDALDGYLGAVAPIADDAPDDDVDLEDFGADATPFEHDSLDDHVDGSATDDVDDPLTADGDDDDDGPLDVDLGPADDDDDDDDGDPDHDDLIDI